MKGKTTAVVSCGDISVSIVDIVAVGEYCLGTIGWKLQLLLWETE